MTLDSTRIQSQNFQIPETHPFTLSERPPVSSRPIQVLPSDLVNKIAAGEVVERPASVVKELMENALDAGATEIEVHVKKGGIEEIRVIDNGSGMRPEDMKLAVQSHATSKITCADDLSQIQTFGFRGEALAAISHVCLFQMVSRPKELACGFRLTCEGGRELNFLETGSPPGTDILIQNLFYNIPARRKFLRSPTTEFGHIQEIFIRMALFQKGVGFSLKHRDRNVLQISRHSDLLARIRTLLDCSGEMLCLEPSPFLPRIQGYISPTHGIYGNRERYLIFVNGRSVKDRALNHAIATAYRELAPAGSYPLVVLNIEMAAKEVDVNVHPAKAEVRFSQANAIYQLVLNTLRKVLAKSTVSEKSPGQMPGGDDETLTYMERMQGHGEKSMPHSFFMPTKPDGVWARENPSWNPTLTSQTDIFQKGSFSNLKVLGQFRESYLLCEDPNHKPTELVLIDQHAAHERIGYERYKKAYKAGVLVRQGLLISESLEVSALEYGLLEEFLPELKKMGLDIELFGQKTIFIRSIPALLTHVNLQTLIREVIKDLTQFGQSQHLEDKMDRLLMTFACHTMVRANHYLEKPEMEALLKQLDDIDFSEKCPHGRPVRIGFSLNEIERRFGRT